MRRNQRLLLGFRACRLLSLSPPALGDAPRAPARAVVSLLGLLDQLDELAIVAAEQLEQRGSDRHPLRDSELAGAFMERVEYFDGQAKRRDVRRSTPVLFG